VNRDDVGMIERCDGLRFTLEPFAALWISRRRVRKYFDGDKAIQSGVSAL